MTNFAQQMITNALTPIIKANGGDIHRGHVLGYVRVLIATGAFEEPEIKQVFNELAWRGLFNLVGVKRK